MEENHTDNPCHSHTYTPESNVGPLEGTMAGSWSVGIVEESRVRSADDCVETARGDVRGEITWKMPVEENQVATGGRAILLSHVQWVEPLL